MRIEQSTVTKLTLTEIDGLDPVTVILENHAPGKGKIIIECYGEVWFCDDAPTEQLFYGLTSDDCITNLTDLAKSTAPDHQELCRIIDNVQQGLKLYINSKTDKDVI